VANLRLAIENHSELGGEVLEFAKGPCMRGWRGVEDLAAIHTWGPSISHSWVVHILEVHRGAREIDEVGVDSVVVREIQKHLEMRARRVSALEVESHGGDLEVDRLNQAEGRSLAVHGPLPVVRSTGPYETRRRWVVARDETIHYEEVRLQYRSDAYAYHGAAGRTVRVGATSRTCRV
jgi:hypothetical protein